MIRVRGHTLLCLQGFRGEGYSLPFVENLSSIHGCLSENPEQLVEILDSPDAICSACPHRAASGCTIDGQGAEEAMVTQDRDVLRRLGLSAGDRVRWSEVLDRIRNVMDGDILPEVCGECRWLPLGYCREGIDRLRAPGVDRKPLPSRESQNPPRPSAS